MVPAIQIAILITMAATMMALTASEILFDGEHAREGLYAYHIIVQRELWRGNVEASRSVRCRKEVYTNSDFRPSHCRSSPGNFKLNTEASPRNSKHFRATLDNKLEVPPTSTVKYRRSKGFIFTKKAWQPKRKKLQNSQNKNTTLQRFATALHWHPLQHSNTFPDTLGLRP